MASLLEQEADLEAQLENYRSQVRWSRCIAPHSECGVCGVCGVQLTLVKKAGGGGDGGGGEMEQLMQDFQQLIELTERMCSRLLTSLLDGSH